MSYSIENSAVKLIESTPLPNIDKSNFPESVRFVDGVIPVLQDLEEFVLALRKKHPQFKFGVSRNCRSNMRVLDVYNEVWVYRTGDDYALGRIGFCSPNPERSAYVETNAPRYSVYSRAVTNEMYSPDKWSYNAVTSKDLKTAMRNASKYLKIFSPVEYAKMSIRTFSGHISSPRIDSIMRKDRAERDVRINMLEVTTALMDAIKQGFVIPSSELREIIEEYSAARQEYDGRMSSTTNGYYVRITDDMGTQRATVIKIDDVTGHCNGLPVFDLGEVNSITTTDLPEDIMGKLSVLAMLGDDQYVEGVGMKVSPNMFWLIRDEMIQGETP